MVSSSSRSSSSATQEDPFLDQVVDQSSGLGSSSVYGKENEAIATSSNRADFSFVKPDRKPLTVNYVSVTIKLLLSLGLLVALIVGYAVGLKVFSFGFISVGMYGTILTCDFILQFSCAVANRASINRIVSSCRKKQRHTAKGEGEDAPLPPLETLSEKGEQDHVVTAKTSLTNNALMCPDGDVSIAVVGYREDEAAWRSCLQSLQKQTLKPKALITVVDGNDKDDQAMARVFAEVFEGKKAKVIHLPILLARLHQTTYRTLLQDWGHKKSRFQAFMNWIRIRNTKMELLALKEAEHAVIDQVLKWKEEFNIADYDAVCFTQPHGHKRTAMFTAFAVAMYAYQTREAVFTTDSDTLLQENALDEMLVVMRSSGEIGGVTADVRIWNRRLSILARMCSVRYWMAFNIERACQSWWQCVGCISGPMGLYRACDLHDILGPWNLQTFGGKETTFGDDRHLTNQILAKGLRTRYTHRTYCESESPTEFVRWVKQQTRWSKSFFREAFWFPASFAYQSWWMLVETTKQALYPFILVATVFHFLFSPSDPLRPAAWLLTMFGVALIKSLAAALISRDPWMLCFSGYGFIYFFGLLPSKIYALTTMTQTGWGTSARSSGEIKKGDTFMERSFHVGYLAFWYICLAAGLGFFLSSILGSWWYAGATAAALPACYLLYYKLPSIKWMTATATVVEKKPLLVPEIKVEIPSGYTKDTKVDLAPPSPVILSQGRGKRPDSIAGSEPAAASPASSLFSLDDAPRKGDIIPDIAEPSQPGMPDSESSAKNRRRASLFETPDNLAARKPSISITPFARRASNADALKYTGMPSLSMTRSSRKNSLLSSTSHLSDSASSSLSSPGYAPPTPSTAGFSVATPSTAGFSVATPSTAGFSDATSSNSRRYSGSSHSSAATSRFSGLQAIQKRVPNADFGYPLKSNSMGTFRLSNVPKQNKKQRDIMSNIGMPHPAKLSQEDTADIIIVRGEAALSTLGTQYGRQEY